MVKHRCHREDLLREMHGDIKKLVSEVQAINGSVCSTKHDIVDHKKESVRYRKKVDEAWAIIHTLKYAITLLFTAGFIWKLIEWMSK